MRIEHAVMLSSSQAPVALPGVFNPGTTLREIHAFGDTMRLHLSGAETGGRYTMFTSVTPPGSGPPIHQHHLDDEWFHVLEGVAEFYYEGTWTRVEAGGSVFMPKGSVHTFRNAGDVPLHQLITLAPAGFDTFFSRCAEEFNQEGGPDHARLVAIAGEHGIVFPEV